jgi:hypothetical protein
MKLPSFLGCIPDQTGHGAASCHEIIPPVGHNAFTDCQVWNGELWLAYRSSLRSFGGHFADRKSRIVIMHSPDGYQWTKSSELTGNNQDIRDPKLFIHQNRLVLNVLLNRTFDPRPYQTIYTASSDGYHWGKWQNAAPIGRLVGKAVLIKGLGFFAPAHDIRKGNVHLMKLTENLFWKPVMMISREGDETAVTTLSNGGLAAVIRMEKRRGTGITWTAAPDLPWKEVVTDTSVRLDGPSLFPCGTAICALGRRPAPGSLVQRRAGSIRGRMRTALFQVRPGNLRHLLDLPSNGDTGYAGTALFLGKRFVTYYSSPLEQDRSWIRGMLGSCGLYSAILDNDIPGTQSVPQKEFA